jgi:hypothetical protein
MRLKKEHGGYHSSGLWLKYSRPVVEERPGGKQSKKLNKKKWCGKVGVEHVWHRYRRMRWNDEAWDYIDPYEVIECAYCWERKSPKTAKTLDLPLHLWIKQDNGSYAVQVSVNGDYKPLPQLVYKKGVRWCYDCQRYH